MIFCFIWFGLENSLLFLPPCVLVLFQVQVPMVPLPGIPPYQPYHTHATGYVEMRRLPRFVWSLYTTTRAYVSGCPRTKAWCLSVSFITITQDVPRKCCQIALRRMSAPNALGIVSPTFPLFRDTRSTEGVHLDWKLPIQRITEQGRSIASWLLQKAGQSVLNPCHCQCLRLEGISPFRCIH